MKKFLLLIYSTVLSVNFSASQIPNIKMWDRRFGGLSDDEISTVRQTADGGFILGGTSVSASGGDKTQNSSGTNDFWIVRLDAGGNKLWDKDFGGTLRDYLWCVQQTSDGGFILGGYSYSGIGGDKTESNRDSTNLTVDYWIVKTDSLGSKIWDKTFGGTGHDQLFSVQQTFDGGYVLGGYSNSGINGDKTQAVQGSYDYWIIKTDSAGTKIWDVDLGGSALDVLQSMQQTSDGGYILGGYSSSGISGDKSQPVWDTTTASVLKADYWIVKIDASGNKVWDRDYGGFDVDLFYSLQQTADGGYILGGYSISDSGADRTQYSRGFYDYWIVKTDSLGNKIWDKRFGGSAWEDLFGNVSQTQDHGYLLAGTSYSNLGGDKSENNLGLEQTWIVKTDSMGNMEWDKTIFTPGHDEAAYAIQTREGCYATAVWTDGGIGGYKSETNWGTTSDYWIIMFCDSANVPPPVSNFNTVTNTLCPGSCTQFNNLSQHADSLIWIFPGGIPATSSDPIPGNVCYITEGTFDVTLIASNSSGSDTLTLPGYITVYPEPNIPLIIQSGDTLFLQPGYASYQWYHFNTLIPGATDYYYIAPQSGDYSVVITDSNGCDAGRGIVNVIASTTNMEEQDIVRIFPNPSFGTFTVQGKSEFASFPIEIADVFGRIVYSELFNNYSTNLNKKIFLDAPAGIYFVKVADGKTSLNTSVVIQK